MTPDPPELLSALIDRESVDPDALAKALDDPAQRALLVDFIRLRLLIQDDGDEGEEPLVHHGTELHEVRPRHVAVRTALAAGVVIALLGAAFWVNWKSETLPPEPARVLAFRPGVDWQ